METWKDIQGFEGLYQVSSYGNVKSLGNGNSTQPSTKQERIIKPRVKNNGYLQAKISKDSKRYHVLIHRLVALAFLGETKVKLEVNHIDGNKTNNHVSNLEWATSSENKKHGFKTGLFNNKKGADHAQSKPIRQLNLDGSLVREWGSIKQVKRELGFNTVGIIKCCKKEKRYKTAYGFKWEYKECLNEPQL